MLDHNTHNMQRCKPMTHSQQDCWTRARFSSLLHSNSSYSGFSLEFKICINVSFEGCQRVKGEPYSVNVIPQPLGSVDGKYCVTLSNYGDWQMRLDVQCYPCDL